MMEIEKLSFVRYYNNHYKQESLMDVKTYRCICIVSKYLSMKYLLISIGKY